jgi:hypothetical protein
MSIRRSLRAAGRRVIRLSGVTVIIGSTLAACGPGTPASPPAAPSTSAAATTPSEAAPIFTQTPDTSTPTQQTPTQLPATLTQGGAEVTVKSAGLADTISVNESGFRPGSTYAKYTKRPAGEGYKFFVVTTSVTNNGSHSMDLTCALPIATLFKDTQAREFDSIEDLYKIEGNPECNTGAIQPEQSTAMTWVYRIPISATPGQWGFADLEGGGLGQTNYEGIGL